MPRSRFLVCLALFLSLLTTPALAQVSRGSLLLRLTAASPVHSPHPVPEAAAGLGLFRNPAPERTELYLSTNLAYAPLDRLLVGGQFSLSVSAGGDHGRRSYALQPYARYYLVNRAQLLAFGEVSTVIGYDGYDGYGFDRARVAAGLQLPLGGGTYLTPALQYSIGEGENSVGLAVGIEVLLGRRDTSSLPATNMLGRGRVMLGGQSGSYARTTSTNATGLELGGHYLLTDRLAAAALFGYSRSHASYSFRNGTDNRHLTTRELHLAAGLRYYLAVHHRLGYYAEVGAGRVSYTIDTNVGVDYFDPSFTYLTVGGGAQYFLRRHLTLEAGPQLRYDLTNERWVPGLNVGVRVLLVAARASPN